MNAELVLFGRRVDMAPRHRRRTLVVALYLVLTVLIAILWPATRWHGSGLWLFWGVMIACRLFLGGYYTGGLVKPFNNRPPRQPDAPPSLLMLRLRAYRPILQADQDSFRSDERELSQRNQAHYIAYQVIGCGLAVLWLLASIANDSPRLFASIAIPPQELFCGITNIALTLFFTLPQAILLWTEPDMEQV